MGGPAIEQSDGATRVRLHITPFNPELLDRIIAPSIRPLASNISYHTVQTFPERGFGYVELPAMEAQKLKKKLNGSTLKGAKVRIEDAKPEKKRKSDDEDDVGARKARKSARKSKSKSENGVISGHELEEGRHVKRGWKEDGVDTGEKGKDDKGGKKLRFKTTTPPNKSPVEDSSTDKKKPKKGKDGKKKVVVEEFDKNAQPPDTPMQDQQVDPGSVTYEDGRGWVNEAGDVVEAERRSKRRSRKDGKDESQPRVTAIESREVLEDVNMPAPEHEDDSHLAAATAAEEEAGTAESGIGTADGEFLKGTFQRPTTSASSSRKSRPMPIDTSFGFGFGGNSAEQDDSGTDMPPQTPRTKQDMEWRSLRSAAPTPDTAALGRKFSLSLPANDEDEDELEDIPEDDNDDVEMAEADEVAPGAAQENAGESEFRSGFYGNRGDSNRGWKKRRREERKSKRQRENRRLSRKVA